MRIVEIDPRSDPLWSGLVQRRGGSVFVSPNWLWVISDTYGFGVSALVALDDGGRAEGGVAFSTVADPAGERLVSLPFSDYCDPLVTSQAQWDALAGVLIDRGRPLDVRCLNSPYPPRDPRFSAKGAASWHGVELQEDADATWKRIRSNGRREVRRAQQRGVEVEPAEDVEGLRRFYELHLGVRKYKYRLLAQPYRFFENIWSRFIARGQGALLLARQEQRVIAGTLYLRWGDTLYYKFSASDPAYLDCRPNDLLVWEGLTYAHAHGCRRFDFGLSDSKQEGLLRFKRKFATEEGEIRSLRYQPPSWRSRGSPELREILDSLTPLLTSEAVPDPVTEEAGEILYALFA